MSDIQRYFAPSELEPWKNHHGNWVRYADHVEALRQAQADERLEQIGGGEAWQIGFEDGRESALVDERKRSVLLIADAYGKGLDDARDAVAALEDWQPPNMGQTLIGRESALTAIDALRTTR